MIKRLLYVITFVAFFIVAFIYLVIAIVFCPIVYIITGDWELIFNPIDDVSLFLEKVFNDN